MWAIVDYTAPHKLATGAVATLALCSVLAASPAYAQQTIALTAIDGYPPKSLWIKTFIEHFIPEVDKALAKSGKYKIRWNQAWGGQIVKPRHVFEGLQKGLGDIGIVTTVFHLDKVPLQGIGFVTPFENLQDIALEVVGLVENGGIGKFLDDAARFLEGGLVLLLRVVGVGPVVEGERDIGLVRVGLVFLKEGVEQLRGL